MQTDSIKSKAMNIKKVELQKNQLEDNLKFKTFVLSTLFLVHQTSVIITLFMK